MKVHTEGRGNSVTKHKIIKLNLCLSNYFICVPLLKTKKRTTTIKIKQSLYSEVMTPGPLPLKVEAMELTSKGNSVTKTRIRSKR